MKRVSITQITLDPRLQHRELSAEYVNDLIAAVEDGAKLPPISLIYDGDTYWCYDGFHRVSMARILKWTEIDAIVHDADFRAAWELSLGVNDKVGLRRTSAEVQSILAKVFADPALCKLSDRQVAKLVNVGKTTVFRYRQALNAAPESTSNPLSTNKPSRSGGGSGAADKQRAVRQAWYTLSYEIDRMGKFDALKDALAQINSVLGL